MTKRYRLRASPFRRCTRAWVRHDGRVVRLLCFNDYAPCAEGGDPRTFFKRITHKRWPKGWHMSGCEYSSALTKWYADLPADKWVECVVERQRNPVALLTAGSEVDND